MCTVDMACVLVPLPFAEGATMLSVTPCGTESGREPILDWHGEVVVKFLDAGVRKSAGKRNVGIESDGCTEGRDAHWAHRRRAGANMVLMLVNGLVGDFLRSMFAGSSRTRDSAILKTPNVLCPTITTTTLLHNPATSKWACCTISCSASYLISMVSASQYCYSRLLVN